MYDTNAPSVSADSRALIDLRSDTVTRPCAAMRRAMADAEVADDMYGEDPTVNRLQAQFAEIVGKEAALFVPSGTMGNQIAIHMHVRPGDEILCDANSHIIHYEAGAPAALSGAGLRGLQGRMGLMDLHLLQSSVRLDNYHHPRTTLLVIENTHNRGGGMVWPLDMIHDASNFAREHGMATHLDGARLWNAVAATGVSAADYAAPFDTVTCCFSKGLGAPVGSAIAGSRDAIREARRIRKMFGGAMRQAGILAAAALYALDHNRDRLAEDHANARAFAEALAVHPAYHVEPDAPTNMVFWTIAGCGTYAAEFTAAARAQGVLVNHVGAGRFRIVTHLDASREMVQDAANRLLKLADTFFDGREI